MHYSRKKPGLMRLGLLFFQQDYRAGLYRNQARAIFDASRAVCDPVVVSHTKSEDDLVQMILASPRSDPDLAPVYLWFRSGVQVLRVIGHGDTLVPADCDAVIVDESHGSGKGYDGSYARDVVEHQPSRHSCRGTYTGECRGRDPGDPSICGRCCKWRRDRTGNKRS